MHKILFHSNHREHRAHREIEIKMDEKQLKEHLHRIGMECFVNNYETFSDASQPNIDVINFLIKKYRYTRNASTTRASNARKIINDGYGNNALKIIIESKRISDELKEKALELLEQKNTINNNGSESTYKNGLEGIQKETTYLRRTRDPRLVEERKKIDNFTCQACGYRKEISRDRFIIDVHHINPIGQLKDVSITSVDDLICLCPNCHRIAHSNENKPYTLEEIKTLLKK